MKHTTSWTEITFEKKNLILLTILIKWGILTKLKEKTEIYASIYTQIFPQFSLIYTLFWIPNIIVNCCDYVVYFVMVLIGTMRVNDNDRKKIK